MKYTVNNVKNQKFELDVAPGTSIAEMKKLISESQGYPVEGQSIV